MRRAELDKLIKDAVDGKCKYESVCLVVNALEEIFHDNDDDLKEEIAIKLITADALLEFSKAVSMVRR